MNEPETSDDAWTEVLFWGLGALLLLLFGLTPIAYVMADDRMHPAEIVKFVSTMGVLLGLVAAVPIGRGCCRLMRHLRATDDFPVSRSEKIAGTIGALLFLTAMAFLPRSVALALHGERLVQYAKQLEAGEKEFWARNTELNNRIHDLQQQYEETRVRGLGLVGGRRDIKSQLERENSEWERISAEIRRLTEIQRHNEAEWKKLTESGGRYRLHYR